MKEAIRIDDRSTSDVVVRIRIQDGRDEYLYCHSHILIEKSSYFSDRLSENWPTHQMLDSLKCVEVYCKESDFDYHVSILRLMYVSIDDSKDGIWQNVRNALNILQVAFELGCEQIILSCTNYLEAAPWEEAEEEEILRIVPGLGRHIQPILARLYPVNQSSILHIFFSALQFVTSSPPFPAQELKSSIQEQLEYMVTEDDDDPLIIPDNHIKSEVQKCVGRLFFRFNSFMENMSYPIPESETIQTLFSHLSDILWAWQITSKMDLVREFVCSWIGISATLLVIEKVDHIGILAVKMKIIEIVSNVFEVVGLDVAILPTSKRVDMVKMWLPFARVLRPLLDVSEKGGDYLNVKTNDDLWQSLESSLCSVILTLPLENQAEIFSDWWLVNKHICYPDLTEAFQAWCYRSKVSNTHLNLNI